MSPPKELIDGFRRFRKNHFADRAGQYRELAQFGQAPKALVIACCDSRVDPALVLDCAPGDLFVVRNVANLVPPAENQGHYHGTSAALEFGVRNLQVPHVIVLGHTMCGGIHALLEDSVSSDESYIAEWMGIAAAARKKVDGELADATDQQRHRACEQQAILVSLANLMSFSWVRERVEAGLLSLHGWHFDIEAGELFGYSTESRQFEPL
jgi:carbonic anhydrase